MRSRGRRSPRGIIPKRAIPPGVRRVGQRKGGGGGFLLQGFQRNAHEVKEVGGDSEEVVRLEANNKTNTCHPLNREVSLSGEK